MRRCLSCGQVTSGARCPACHRAKRNARYGGPWPTHSRTVIAAHVAAHGPRCQGWRDHEPHDCAVDDLTLDHETQLVLCRAANSGKRDRG